MCLLWGSEPESFEPEAKRAQAPQRMSQRTFSNTARSFNPLKLLSQKALQQETIQSLSQISMLHPPRNDEAGHPRRSRRQLSRTSQISRSQDYQDPEVDHEDLRKQMRRSKTSTQEALTVAPEDSQIFNNTLPKQLIMSNIILKSPFLPQLGLK